MPRVLSPIKNDRFLSLAVGNNLLDSILVDEYSCCIWDVIVEKPQAGAGSTTERGLFTVYAIHDGSALADATENGSGMDVIGGAVTSSIVDEVSILVALGGAGPTQALQLVVSVAVTGWQVVHHRRPLVGTGD